MTTRILRLCAPFVVAVAVLVGAPHTASAQGFISPLVGFNFGGDANCPEIDDCEDKTLNLGVSIGKLGLIGFEQEFAYAKDFFGDAPGFSSSVLTVMSNLLIAPKIGPVRPYGLVGLGLIKSHTELTQDELLETDNNNFGWNVGGGLMVGGAVALRGDIRYFHAFQDLEVLGVTLGDTKLDFARASAAIVFTF